MAHYKGINKSVSYMVLGLMSLTSLQAVTAENSAIVPSNASVSVPIAALERNAARSFNIQTPEDGLTSFSAREVVYDETKNLLEARGRVRIKFGNQIVHADTVRYDVNKDKIEALGNVSLENTEGTLLARTDKVELDNEFNEAITDKMVMRLADGSRITATKVVRSKGRYNTLYNATYSTCGECLVRQSTPTWLVRVSEMRYDAQKEYIVAKNIFFDLKGQPILWVPYFGYSSKNTNRRTGFLVPRITYGKLEGLDVAIPFNIVISDYADLLLTPYIYAQKNPMLHYRLRQNFEGGGVSVTGSFTQDNAVTESYAPSRNVPYRRWHIDAALGAQIGDRWFVDGQLRSVSDRYYFNDYDVSNNIDKSGFLHSNFNLKYQGEDSWFQGETHYFLPQSTGIQQEYIPFVFPRLNYQKTMDDPILGGSLDLELDAIALHQQKNVDIDDLSKPLPGRSLFGANAAKETARVMGVLNWNKYFVNPLGMEHETDINLTALAWKTSDYYVGGNDYSGTEGLLRPTLSTSVAYPLVRQAQNSSIIIEPMMQAVWSPEYDPKDYLAIPNTDSQVMDLTAVNLFTANRFSGQDRDEGGFRLNYGVKTLLSVFNVESSMVFGQVYRPEGYEHFSKNSGMDSEFSDYVTRLDLNYDKWFSFDGMFRLDQDDFSLRRADLSSAIGPASFKVKPGYTWFKNLENPNGDISENLTLDISAQLTPNMHISGYMSKDLQDESDQFSEVRSNLRWENESLAIAAYAKREWKKSGKFDDSFGFQLSLKTLADFGLDF